MVGDYLNSKILIIGDTVAPYHPLTSIFPLSKLLCDYSLTFTNDYDYFLKLYEFNLCICYADSWGKQLSNNQSASLKEYLFNGGKLLSIHNGISLQDTPDLTMLHGAKFTHHPPYDKLLIKTAAGHPATEGVESFYLYDEPYHYEIYEDFNIFASYDFNGKSFPAAWEKACGSGTLIYLMPGHDESAFQCDGYLKLIKNCINYLQDN